MNLTDAIIFFLTADCKAAIHHLRESGAIVTIVKRYPVFGIHGNTFESIESIREETAT